MPRTHARTHARTVHVYHYGVDTSSLLLPPTGLGDTGEQLSWHGTPPVIATPMVATNVS
jgi:hypothetical protein